MLPVIFFAILFGVFVNKLGKKEKDTLTGIFDALFFRDDKDNVLYSAFFPR